MPAVAAPEVAQGLVHLLAGPKDDRPKLAAGRFPGLCLDQPEFGFRGAIYANGEAVPAWVCPCPQPHDSKAAALACARGVLGSIRADAAAERKRNRPKRRRTRK